MSVFVRFGIGATIRTRRDIQCLPYEAFFLLQIYNVFKTNFDFFVSFSVSV